MIRDRKPEDDAAIAQLIREVEPGWVTTERGVGHRRLRTPARARRRDWVAELEGEVVAWSAGALETDVERDDVAWLSVRVRPAWRERGIAAALYEPLEEHVLGLGARRLLAEAADEQGARTFAERRGFRQSMTRRLSWLDPRTHDGSELAALAAEKEAEGFTLAPFAAFQETPELIHAVDAEATLDEPSDEPLTGMPLDEWLHGYWEQPDLSREGSFCVVHEGRPVALGELRVDLDGGRAGNGFTATLRDYRSRRLARLVKLASIDWLRQYGVGMLVTQNDETNAAMLAVNTHLGYRPFESRHSYVKDIE